jgi:dTDP-4-amino-4,6-dideoxygalactose transaminase
VDSWNEKRREIARHYTEQLAPLGMTVPVECDWGKHVYHLYIIRSDRRAALQAFLKERGIASEVYYPLPPHLSTPCRKLGYQEGDYPHAERASQETLALPLYPELTTEQQDRVVASVREFVG